MSSLVNFVATGDPNGDGVPAWPTFDRRTPSTMRWNVGIEVGETGYDAEKMALLDDLNGWTA